MDADDHLACKLGGLCTSCKVKLPEDHPTLTCEKCRLRINAYRRNARRKKLGRPPKWAWEQYMEEIGR